MCIYVNFMFILWKWVFLDLKRMIFDIYVLLKFLVYEYFKVFGVNFEFYVKLELDGVC